MKLREKIVLFGFVLSTNLWAGSARIEIDASKPGTRLNPNMYGIFLEEINHGVDGGLYAEMVRNRGFEDAKPPEGFTFRDGRWLDAQGYNASFGRFGYFTNGLPFWSLIKEDQADGAMYLDLADPLSAATPRSLRLEITKASPGRVGIANEGFWGMGLNKGARYNLSFFARCADGFDGAVTASLESAQNTACSQLTTIKGIGAHWKQFKATLTATATDPKARLVISAGSTGKVWFDLVSLFPAATFKGHGLRPDLAQLIADLKPGFVRFPGGCVVEGGTIETAYNWKHTIGPLQEREEVWGPWNYRRTHGMGYYEYLQFCEDLGAEPLYVGFAGETCMFRQAEDLPLAQMGWVVTNFLDAIEYAIGPASSPWGKLRAQQGHPEPFGLKLVEVGNENGTRNFPERYRLVHSALKARFPNLKYIADLSYPRFMGEEAFDIEDNHFYYSPQWFMNNFHHYDQRDRSRPPVYDGEVAVTSGEGGRDKGNLISALGEGAFLLGLERNADVVRMVSYAPLLANVRGRTDWHGMICFDTTRSYGTVSYHLWKLFGLNRPTYTVQTEVQGLGGKPAPITGAVGVGTWNTSAEFKDIRVEKNGAVLYLSDFATNAAGGETDGGNWSVVDGAYRQADTVVGLSYFGDQSWSDYTITLKARKLRGAEGFLVAFGRKGQERNWWNLGGWGNTEHAIELNQNSLGAHVPGRIEADRWYEVKIQLDDRRIRCYLDGQLIHDETAPVTQRFFAVAGRDEQQGDLVLKCINASSEPQSAVVNVDGVAGLASAAETTVLTSEQRGDNNSLENPARVVPVTTRVNIPGRQFNHDFPANSFTLMRIKIR